MYRVFLLLLTTIFIGCTTQKVEVDYERTYDFSQIKTFTIVENFMHVPSPEGVISELDVKRIKAATLAELQNKGMTTSSKPDFIIALEGVEFIEEGSAPNVGASFGMGNAGSFGSIGVGVPVNGLAKRKQEVNVGIRETQTNKLIWHGILRIAMPTRPSSELRLKAIQKGVNKLFANFPPESDN